MYKGGQKKTFAQGFNNTSQLPTPCVKGDRDMVQINEEDYQAKLEIVRTTYMVA